jgi:S1-C subfamily serine protease
VKLTYKTGPYSGQAIDVDGRTFVVGRGGDSDIALKDDTEVSRRHATLEPRSDGTVLVTDLGSTNGTFVNGQRISGPVLLRGGDSVRFGDTSFDAGELPPADATRFSSSPAVAGVAGVANAGTAQPPGAGPPPPLPPDAVGPPPSPPPGTPLPLPPKPPSPSMVERIRLRRSVMRANVLAVTAVGLAVLVIGVVVVLAVTGVLGGGGESSDPAPAQANAEQITEEFTPATVLITSKQDGQDYAGGTGWVLDARQGLIGTNNHVVSGGDSWTIGVGNERREASFVAAAPCEDQAVLKLDNVQGLKQMPLGTQATLKPGAGVVAIGFPVNASTEDNLTSTAGVVSVVREKYTGALDVPNLQNVIQTDAAINPGNSGGPLLSTQRVLVGMNTAGLDEAGGRTIQGQGYAIGVDRIKEIMGSTLRRGKSIGFTGLGIEPASPSELASAGLPPGLHTVEAIPGSPADQAGFGDGVDRAITKIDGKSLDGSLPNYCDAVQNFQSGQTAKFTIAGPGRQVRDVDLKFM